MQLSVCDDLCLLHNMNFVFHFFWINTDSYQFNVDVLQIKVRELFNSNYLQEVTSSRSCTCVIIEFIARLTRRNKVVKIVNLVKIERRII